MEAHGERGNNILMVWGLQLLEETDRTHVVGEAKEQMSRDIASVLKIIHALELRNEQSSK